MKLDPGHSNCQKMSDFYAKLAVEPPAGSHLMKAKMSFLFGSLGAAHKTFIV